MSQKMTETNTFPAWITRYALTTGIEEITARQSYYERLITDANRTHCHYFGENTEWHRTREGAVIRAEEMRAARIASLRKSITKLEKVSFK